MNDYTQDYGQAQQRQQMLQSMLANSRKPMERATSGLALGKILQQYFLSKGEKSAVADMAEASQGQKDSDRKDMANILGAYRQDTPYQQSEAETFPGEAPIPGLSNKGTGQDVNAMAQAMIGAENPKFADTGFKSLMGLGKTNQPTARIKEDQYRLGLVDSGASDERLMAFDRTKLITVRRGDKIDYLHPQTGEVVDSQPINVSTDKKPENVAAAELAKKTTASQVKRWDDQMSEGLQAADGIPILARSLDLLKAGIETGGLDALKLKASNFFGVTGADEAELSANLGRAVLSQLRATFGAAFTEREGDRLAFIEASFGKSTKANIRLLEQLDRMARREAKRGIKAAKAAGDDDMAQAIQEAIDFKLDIEPKEVQIAKPQTEAAFNKLKSGDIYIDPDDGKQYRKP